MLTVVTQNSRLPRSSAPSGDRMAFGFGYPHCSVLDARCQVSPGFLAKSVTCSRQIQPISQPPPNFFAGDATAWNSLLAYRRNDVL